MADGNDVRGETLTPPRLRREPEGAIDFVEWFRRSAPYIREHRGRTFVVMAGGEAMTSAGLPDLVHDIALLHSLGVRVVLLMGSRPQIDKRLAERGKTSEVVNAVRVTDADALLAAKESAGINRVELERLLSTRLPGTPMAGGRMKVAAGNFVIARPWGVIDGVDYKWTGRVRKIDVPAIRQRLDDDALVILTPLGYSLTGDSFNLATHELGAETAIALGADKLIALVEGKGVTDGKGGIITEMDPDEAEAILRSKRRLSADTRRHLGACLHAVRGGVPRAHLVDRRARGALLRELYTREGAGTLVTAERLEGVRPARLDDVPSMLALLAPLEAEGLLVKRPQEVLEGDIPRFMVVERDGLVMACAALYEYPDEKMGEFAGVAVAPEFRRSGRGEALLRAQERRARELGLERIFVLTTQGVHWFVERGFAPAKPKDLPASRKHYDTRRKSKVLIKEL